jgi:hypothetical protein
MAFIKLFISMFSSHSIHSYSENRHFTLLCSDNCTSVEKSSASNLAFASSKRSAHQSIEMNSQPARLLKKSQTMALQEKHEMGDLTDSQINGQD